MKSIPEKYHAYLEMIISAAREFLSTGKELQGMAFLGKLGEGVVPIPMHMDRKDQSSAMLREICRITRPDYVMLISEAWMLMKPGITTEEFNKAREKGIANHPDRQDIIMLSLETQEGFWFGQSHIKSLGGKARGFDDLQFEMTKQSKGRFASFLPREGMQH